MLHGGGPINNQVFDRFIQQAGGKKARIVFVPSAGFRRGWYDSDAQMIADLSHRYSSWVQLAEKRQVESFQFLFTDDPDDADDPEFTKPLETATGVWFSGGDQLRLNYRFVGSYPRQTRFQRGLVWVLQRGGAVGGTSAGMAAMPEIMTLWDERPNWEAPAAVVPGHGFGLLRQAIVEQHFDARGGRLERFTTLLRDNRQLDELAGRRGAGANMIGLAAEETAALLVQGNRIEALGDANVHVFIKSSDGRAIAWHQMSPGESAIIDRSTPQAAGLIRQEPQLLR
jgi:cyanophycinase